MNMIEHLSSHRQQLLLRTVKQFLTSQKPAYRRMTLRSYVKELEGVNSIDVRFCIATFNGGRYLKSSWIVFFISAFSRR